MLLGHDLAVELVLVALFLGQYLVAPFLEAAEAAFDPPGLAAIEPHRAARQIGEEAPVVADQHQRAASCVEIAFQPFDGGEIEMVGRFVQQQDVGRGSQHACQRRAARFAAGQVGRIFLAGQSQLLEQEAGLVVIVARSEAGFHIGQRGRHSGKIRLLRQVADGRARLDETFAAVRLDQTGGDFQQRRFARTIAADQAHPLAGGDA